MFRSALKLLFVLVRHSSAKGKQAVLLESLFKESDSPWVSSPFWPGQWRGRPVPYKDISGQAISPYKAKECTGCSLLLPQTPLGMFGKKAEMTGTTIRLPYLEKRGPKHLEEAAET